MPLELNPERPCLTLSGEIRPGASGQLPTAGNCTADAWAAVTARRAEARLALAALDGNKNAWAAERKKEREAWAASARAVDISGFLGLLVVSVVFSVTQWRKAAITQPRGSFSDSNSPLRLLLLGLSIAWLGFIAFLVAITAGEELLLTAVCLEIAAAFSTRQTLCNLVAWELEISDWGQQGAAQQASSSAAVVPFQKRATTRLKSIKRRYDELFGLRGTYIKYRLLLQELVLELFPQIFVGIGVVASTLDRNWLILLLATITLNVIACHYI